MAITLIPSGAYATPELVSEFGNLPPAFLPAGSQRLYQLQQKLLSEASSKIFISLPESFDIPSSDLNSITHLGLEIIYVPSDLSLGESIVYAMNMIGSFHEPLRILLGDSIIYDIDFKDTDCFTAHENVEDYYNWAFCQRKSDSNYWLVEGYLSQPSPGDMVISGYFCFSQPHLLVKSITKARGNFIRGLNFYSGEIGLHPCTNGVWLDFGHIHTYYRTRKYLATQRSFNDVQISQNTLKKSSSTNSGKIIAEQEWYQKLPTSLHIYLPRLVEVGFDEQKTPFYELEYLYMPTLADIFVYGQQAVYVWQQIFSSISDFLNVCVQFKKPPEADIQFEELYLQKTLERLEKFSQASNISLHKNLKLNGCLTPSLLDLIKLVAAQISHLEPEENTIIHGDLCFSNILYDFRSKSVKVIDPRGLVQQNRKSIYGDQRYDIAKLCHSVIGRYDFIISGYYNLKQISEYEFEFSLPNSSLLQELDHQFFSSFTQSLKRYSSSIEIMAITILLFLSMLPLHADRPDRQKAFLANALRLFLKMEAKLS
jgi:hypothetical protein